METIALYIGYTIIAIIGIALLAIAIFTLYLTVIGFYRILSTKQTIRFMQKAEARATAEGVQAAYDLLIKKGCSDLKTLGEVKESLRRFRMRNKLELSKEES